MTNTKRPTKRHSGQFKPGNKFGKGREKGSKNKLPLEVKDMVTTAMSLAGQVYIDRADELPDALRDQDAGVVYLTQQALANPKAFLPLVARLMPAKVDPEGIAESLALVDILTQRRQALANLRTAVMDATPEMIEVNPADE